jgi:hypothetical protein
MFSRGYIAGITTFTRSLNSLMLARNWFYNMKSALGILMSVFSLPADCPQKYTPPQFNRFVKNINSP